MAVYCAICGEKIDGAGVDAPAGVTLTHKRCRRAVGAQTVEVDIKTDAESAAAEESAPEPAEPPKKTRRRKASTTKGE